MKYRILFLVFAFIECITAYYTESEQPLRSVSSKYIPGKEIKNFMADLLNTRLQNVCQPNLSIANTRTIRLLNRNFQKCFNSTVDSFTNQINDDDFNGLADYSTAYRLVTPFCALSRNVYLCLEKFLPVIDLCVPLEYLHIKSKILAFVPVIQKTVCQDNGAGLVLLLQYHADFHCVERALQKQYFTKLLETVLASDEEEIFTTKSTCVDLLDTGENITTILIQCPHDVTNIVVEMLANLCDSTKCNEVIGYSRCEFN